MIIGLIAILMGLFFIYKKLSLLFWICIVIATIDMGVHFYKKIKKQKETFVMFNFMGDQANVQAHPEMYCGTSPNLPDEYDRMGTRPVCLKKGIGIGMAMPTVERNAALARSANRPPLPKLYCGASDVLPAGYVGLGTNMDCLKRGVGVGMRIDDVRRQAFQNRPVNPLSKKEIMSIAKRLHITTDDKTRNQTLRSISDRLRV